MIAADAATVSDLNRRARADRVAGGVVTSEVIDVAGGRVAGVGDEVVTRQNHRLLVAGGRWVKNGDRWVVTAIHEDGSLAVRRAGGHGEVVLPVDYVTSHVELAYATTAHRAQGRTVDTAHAMVSPATTREVLYVSATRGRASNRLYVDVAFDPDPETGHADMTPEQDARTVLAAVLANEGADVSAHETIRRERHAAGNIATLIAEYQTIARIAQAERWDRVLSTSGLTNNELAQPTNWRSCAPAMPTALYWQLSPTPKSVALTSKQHCRAWLRKSHSEVWSTSLPCCTNGSIDGSTQRGVRGMS